MAVPSIEEFLRRHEVLYGEFEKGPVVVNERQRVREMFITDGGTVLELLEPLDRQSPIVEFLERNGGGGLVHVAIEVDDLDDAIMRIRQAGGRVVVGPEPDVAFDERRIAFVFLHDQITELIERTERKSSGAKNSSSG